MDSQQHPPRTLAEIDAYLRERDKPPCPKRVAAAIQAGKETGIIAARALKFLNESSQSRPADPR